MYDSKERTIILLEMLKYTEAENGINAILTEDRDQNLVPLLLSHLSGRILYVSTSSKFARAVDALLRKESICILQAAKPQKSRLVSKYSKCIRDLIAWLINPNHSFSPVAHLVSKLEVDFISGLGLGRVLASKISTYRLQIGGGKLLAFDEQEFACLVWAVLKSPKLIVDDYPSWLRSALATVTVSLST